MLNPDANLPRPNKITLIAFLLLTAILIVSTVWLVAPYLLAIAMGAVLSVVLREFYRMLRNRNLGARLSAGVVTFGAILLIVAPACVFTTLAVSQGIETAKTISEKPNFNMEYLSEAASRWPPLKAAVGNAAAVEEKAREGLKKVASLAPGVVLSVFGGLPEFVLQVLLGLLATYFFLIDGSAFLIWMRDKVPLDPEVRGAVFNAFHETAVSAIVSTLLAALVQATIVALGFLILGIPAIFLAGGITFFLAWVPIFGASPVWLGGAIYLFAQGHVGKGIAMLGVGVLCSVSDNIVYPLVLKGRGEMHPLVGLVAIFGGIHLFGILGVFIGPILAGLLIAVLETWPLIAERFGFLKGNHIVTDSAGTTSTQIITE